jgi:outer membrane protein assembly factor BamE (lipoprotein component of BamABCDE complex)
MTCRSAALAGSCIVMALALGGCARQTPVAFDQATWKQPVEYCATSPRARMVEALIAQHLKPGMPMRDVRALLGPPDGTRGDDSIYYFAGNEQSFFMDTCLYLEVEGAGGRLGRAVVVKDH